MPSTRTAVRDRLFTAIGVRTHWAGTVHPTEPVAQNDSRDPGELLIIIPTPTMSRRLAVTDHTLGLAAVSLDDGGQVHMCSSIGFHEWPKGQRPVYQTCSAS